MADEFDTIFALASGAGRAGVAVVRLSGTQAGPALEALTGGQGLPKPRVATLRALTDPATREPLDQALVLWFPAPHSYTGEAMAELHLHGGRATLLGVTRALAAMEGLRLAEPGEFTRRAFENGKLDLTEAEAVADLVDAQTAAQRRQALRQLDGALGRLYQDWAERLRRYVAFLEADIDFVEDDLPEDLLAHSANELRALAQAIDAHLNDHRRGERLREGLEVAILGAPNAGKSSLLNALAQREAAIVTPVPGTTRDVIEVQMDLRGYPVTLADTAGLRESEDAIETEGVRRALNRAEQADVKILLFDGAHWPAMDPATLALRDDLALTVVNKADLLAETATTAKDGLWFISVATGSGIPELLDALAARFDERFALLESPCLTRARHRAALETCRDHLARALKASADELRAEDARLALRALGRITGNVDVEALLDTIFSSFCIGK